MARERGKSLPETGYKYKKVKIYRAAEGDDFYPDDYVTLALKWAVGHAEHQSAVNEEAWNVLSATVDASDVYEAFNPGEYFYGGPQIRGRVVKVVEARLLSKRIV